MNFDLRFYRKILLRRLPAMLAIVLVCTGIGAALALKLPTTYSTTATMLLEGPRIPDGMATITVDTSPAEQLEILQRQLTTRANLIDISNKYGIYDPAEMNPDEVVSAMRDATTINRRAGRNSATIVEISFLARDPNIAADVVNEYVSLLLEANAAFRTGRAGDALVFFEQEVERLEDELDIQSTRILEFKSANADALPSNLQYHQNRQSQLQQQVGDARRRVTSLTEQRARLVQIFEETGRLQQPQEERLTPQERELAQLEEELQIALLTYTPSNPRVRALQTRVDRLREAVAAAGGLSSGAEDEAARQAELFDLNLAAIDAEIATVEGEIARNEEILADLARRLDRTPANSLALEALERDYANIQGQYNSAVNNLAQARTGERIELSARGQRISVIEQASVPREPTAPNRPLIAGAGLAAGLGLAAALFVLLELMNRTVRRPAELRARLGITPLATIPYMESRAHRFARRGFQVASVLVVLIGIPAALWAVDTYYLPLDLLAERLLDRIGLG